MLPPVTPTVPGGELPAGDDGEMQPVRLIEMGGERADPEARRRNPFRFDEERPESDEEDAVDMFPAFREGDELSQLPVGGGAARPQGGALELSFLGFVESSGLAERIVVLTDGEFV